MTADEILGVLFGPGVNSENRCGRMLDVLSESGDEDAFWPVFLSAWSRCDDTWNMRHEILDAVQECGGGFLRHISAEDRMIYDHLPRWITAYRGCSRDRIFGLSWTLDRTIAAGFARGHRGIRPDDPVVAEVKIRKRDIVAMFNDREEGEILIDFRSLQRVSISNYRAIC